MPNFLIGSEPNEQDAITNYLLFLYMLQDNKLVVTVLK